VRAEPGSPGAAGEGGERSMQGQGHAWARLNPTPHTWEKAWLLQSGLSFLE